MTRGIKTGLFSMLALCASGAFATDAIDISFRPIWSSLSPGKFPYPLFIKIKNNTGSDVSGRLVIEQDSGSLIIPLDVAKHGEKQIPAYPALQNSNLRLDYESNAGGKHIEAPIMEQYAVFRLGYIGDSTGELAFLKLRRQKNGAVLDDNTISAGYCRAEEAPERTAGYIGLDVLFLGEGSERLNERQIEAIKQYVVQGGRLAIPGGANVPMLSIPAWRNVLPIKNAAPKTFPHGLTLAPYGQRGKIDVAEPITVMLGEPNGPHLIADTSSAGPVSIVRPVGIGSVISFGYDPFNDPILSHSNRRQLVTDALKVALFGSRPTRAHEMTLGERRSFDGYSVTYPSAYPGSPDSGQNVLYTHPSAAPAGSLGDTPFNIQLVPSSTVGWVFVGFFFAVIPLNFIFLRIIKRMEWAWVTAPLLSILFASILLSYSKGLYSAKLSRAYTGFVVQDLDSGLSAQWIRASYFLPQGGTYNLTLPNTDEVAPNDIFEGQNPSYGYRGEEEQTNATIVDAGVATLPEVDVPNLAFREFTYHRIDPTPIPIEMKIRRIKGGLEGAVTNRSQTAMSRVALVQLDKTYVLPDLQPGQTAVIGPKNQVLKSAPAVISSGRSSNQVVLFASMKGFDPGGPGTQEANATDVVLICSKAVNP